MRLWQTGLILVILAGLAVVAARPVIEDRVGEAVFRRAVADTVGRDPSADLPDGLHIYLCGTGSPLPDPDRAGPCIGVLAGHRAFIFDVGAGSVRRLSRMGFPTGRTERLYLSHLHSDHFDGLGELMIATWVGGTRQTPLPVAGPAGVDEITAGFNQAYKIDATYRVAHHGQQIVVPSGYGLADEIIDVAAGPGAYTVLLEEGSLKITAFRVNHSPVEPAYGFRVDYRGRSAVISGDTVYSDNLIQMAAGTDLLLHEALNPEMVSLMSEASAAAGNQAIARIFSDIQDYHASPADAARTAEAAGAGRLVIYHIVPPLPSRLLHAYFLRGARGLYSGRIDVGEDGVIYSLPSGEETVVRRRIMR